MKPRPRTAPASLALLAVLAAGGLAACGGDDAGTGSAAESTSTPSQDSPEDTSADDGTQEVSTDQVRLRLPEGWESLEAQEALADGEDGALASIAERLGVPPPQLEATLQDVDLVAVADGGAQGGVLTNVNVLHQPGELPAEQQLAQQLEQFADTTGDVATVDSPVGDVLRADYQLDINGTPGQFEVLLAQVGADVVTITVTSADAADAAEVADMVVSSLEEA
ncbi:hypothetical protein JOE61_002901 [Nocardioides salarius]|uniref:Prokaryotic membrane lipoprotein lipid attachment site profile n=1 Tax=Nocardioides salarius TaxID=374513 RepID=A0ABS2MD91_9ACTN|nr:hypothetical protein [Nocardioides salarius]MBM7509087.1 hypothetical protein [Nocardioides salarius]